MHPRIHAAAAPPPESPWRLYLPWTRLGLGTPWFTLTVLATALTLGLAQWRWPDEVEARWFVTAGEAVGRGTYHGLLTANLLHLGFAHLVLNLYPCWLCGRVLEPTLGRWNFLALTVVAGLASSVAELAWSGAQAVGLSGILYAWFGAAWASRSHHERCRELLPDALVVFVLLGLVVGCLVAPAPDARVAHAAHFAGLLCGICSALPRLYAARFAPAALAIMALGACAVLRLLSLDPTWLKARAREEFAFDEPETARALCEKALTLRPEDRESLRLLARIHRELGDEVRRRACLARLRRAGG
ncbi:MAG: rhomboid family intramembrane serine protease [Verrucomicrobia bacterium]|nr:rhomboid family intramembrane serine protease [Verrucomicrobiota bacterium]